MSAVGLSDFFGFSCVEAIVLSEWNGHRRHRRRGREGSDGGARRGWLLRAWSLTKRAGRWDATPRKPVHAGTRTPPGPMARMILLFPRAEAAIL